MNGILNVSQGQAVPGEAILPESVGALPPQSVKSVIDGALLQQRLDRQVSSAHSHTLEVVKGPLAMFGFSDVELATLLSPLDDRQLRNLRELSTFNVADLAHLVGRLDDETFARLTDIGGLSDSELNALVNEVVRQSGEEKPESSGFDPRVLEKHFGVLLTAIIAFNQARMANAHLRGHFSVMSANAAVAQGKAIREGGNASLYAALGAAVVAGALSLGGMALSLKSFQGRNADLLSNKLDALKASQRQADLQKKLLDPNRIDAKTAEAAQDYRNWLQGQIIDAGKTRDRANWLSELASHRPAQLTAIGNSMSSMSMVVSNVVSASIRLEEIAQSERRVLQESNQNVQKSLTEEQNQVDARDAALLQKLMDIMHQIALSRNSVIEAVRA